MALGPETMREELAKIQKINVTGDIVSTEHIKKEKQCFSQYESVLESGSQEYAFNYSVLIEECTYDSIFAVLADPYNVGANVTVVLTEKSPHALISGKTNFAGEANFTGETNFDGGINSPLSYIILIIVGIGILGVCLKVGLKK